MSSWGHTKVPERVGFQCLFKCRLKCSLTELIITCCSFLLTSIFWSRNDVKESLLVSSLLFNSEAWYNLNLKELELLESVDLMYLRKVLNAPHGTPKEMLYLELGCLPFREKIRMRGLNFLHYIFNEDDNSLIHKFKPNWRKAIRKIGCLKLKRI